MPVPPLPGLPGGAVEIQRRAPSQQTPHAVPPAVYANDIGAHATELDLTLDFANQHPHTGRAILARVAMPWALFDAMFGLMQQINEQRQRLKELPTPPGEEAASTNGGEPTATEGPPDEPTAE